MEQEGRELHSGLGGSSFDLQNTLMFSCPYLGTLEDIDTSLSYPATANHCFRTKSPASVELSHQEAYCLTDMHPACHVFQQSITTSPAMKKKRRVAKSHNRKQRISIYALPLILILLFLAAILWWPAPGTTFQEAIAFGAQLQGEIGETSGSEDSFMAGENEEINQTEAIDPAAATAGNQTAVEDGVRDASLVESSEAEQESPKPAAQVDAASNNETAGSAPQPEAETAPVTENQAVEEEEPAAAADGSTLPDVSESATTAAVAVDETAETIESQDTAAAETVEEKEETAAAAAEAEVVEVTNAEAAESPALVIFDLPVISTQLLAQNTALDQPAATSPDGERLALIGPDTSAPLALREVNNNVRTLFVRESPSLESRLLTVITRRQQAAILGRDSSSAWFKVRLDTGVEGWVNAVNSQAGVDPSSLAVVDSLIAAGTAAPVAPVAPAVSTITAFPVVRFAIVNTGALNLRSGPSVAYEPITIINKGEIVGLLGRRGLGVWVRVRLHNGLEGWVNSSLLAPLT